jgi:His-Xaa-Ser repeat protein HxsA
MDSGRAKNVAVVPKLSAGSPAATGKGTLGNEVDPPMSRSEKLHLQVFRVQIKLNTLGLFNSQITGKLDDETKNALRMFQSVKGLSETGLMSTETLNALAIPAVK